MHSCLTLQEQKRDKFDQVVIETTGLADPEPLIQTFTTIPVSTHPSSRCPLPFRASQAAKCLFHTRDVYAASRSCDVCRATCVHDEQARQEAVLSTASLSAALMLQVVYVINLC